MCGLEQIMGRASGSVRGLTCGQFLLCRVLPDLPRSLQLISSALPHVLPHFWPSQQSLHHIHTRHGDNRVERGPSWRETVLEQKSRGSGPTQLSAYDRGTDQARGPSLLLTPRSREVLASHGGHEVWVTAVCKGYLSLTSPAPSSPSPEDPVPPDALSLQIKTQLKWPTLSGDDCSSPAEWPCLLVGSHPSLQSCLAR